MENATWRAIQDIMGETNIERAIALSIEHLVRLADSLDVRSHGEITHSRTVHATFPLLLCPLQSKSGFWTRVQLEGFMVEPQVTQDAAFLYSCAAVESWVAHEAKCRKCNRN